MRFQAFARFNGGFRFSSRPPHGRAIFQALKSSQGDTWAEGFEGRQAARLFAASMSLAAAQYQIDRALNNANPLTATELLGEIESDYQIVPGYEQTLHERRAIADTRRRVTRGARRESVEDALRSLLGSDFVAYQTIGTKFELVAWPVSPGTVGTFRKPGTPKTGFRLAANVAMTGIPLTVAIAEIPGLALPMVGDTFTVDPDSRNPNIERITISANSPTTITATFTKAHAVGAVALSPHPVWISNQRYAQIVVTFAAATNMDTRRKINELMARMLRGVSRWFVTHNLGDFVLGDPQRGLLGATILG